MKPLFAALALSTALTVPELAAARPVTLTTTLNAYGGNGAYLAIYVTDGAGAYKGTLWFAGGKSKYYSHLSGWERASGGRLAEISGITGASVGAGRTLKVTLDLADGALRRRLQAPYRRGGGRHARQPLGRGGAADRGRRRPARARPQLCPLLHLQHVTEARRQEPWRAGFTLFSASRACCC